MIMNPSTLLYYTRDAKGNDLVKEVALKKFKLYSVQFVCPCCHKPQTEGNKLKDIVSSNFTDWAFVGEYVCENCANLFSLYFYNYIVDPNGIHLYNVRELREQLITPQKPPFLFVITTSRKKHLFYRSKWNHSNVRFAVNLEMETIYTNRERMNTLFNFVESLQTIGCSKERLSRGEIPFTTLKKTGYKALSRLRHELETSREIQIPLYCGQAREITEEEALCCINSILEV